MSYCCSGHRALAAFPRAVAYQAYQRVLLEHGANVDAEDEEGWTPLHGAAGSRSVELVCMLLEHGADRTLRTDDGRLAADLASGDGLAELLGA